MNGTGETLNPGIARTVALLQEHGFRTCDSGDGRTHDHACDRPFAYVAMLVEPAQLVAECDRLRALLAARGVQVESCGPTGREPHIQGSYDPTWTTAVIDLVGVDDAALGLA